jgi:hypothetical protein
MFTNCLFCGLSCFHGAFLLSPLLSDGINQDLRDIIQFGDGAVEMKSEVNFAKCFDHCLERRGDVVDAQTYFRDGSTCAASDGTKRPDIAKSGFLNHVRLPFRHSGNMGGTFAKVLDGRRQPVVV